MIWEGFMQRPLWPLKAAACPMSRLIAILLMFYILAVWTTGRVTQVKASGEKDPNVKIVTVAAQSGPGAIGQWGGVLTWPIPPVHASVLPNGKLLFWGRDKQGGFDVSGGSNAYVWDPFYDKFTLVRNTTTNLFCSGHSFLPDGKLLVTGGHNIAIHPDGHLLPELEGVGERHINIFDYRTNSWSRGPDMAKGRWYPYNVTLANGETAIVAGSYLNRFLNGAPSFLQNTTAEIFSLNDTLPLGGTLRPSGTFPIQVPPYPFLHLAPDSRVFMASAGGFFLSMLLNPATDSWSFGPDAMKEIHDVGTSVTYDLGKVMVAGGRAHLSRAINRVEVINFNQSSPVWSDANPMNFPRMHFTSVLLPDGKVFVAGGTKCTGTNTVKSADCPDGAVKTPEIWDPATGQWSVMAPHQKVRVYHSTALLLPDARVLVGGGGLPSAEGECNKPEGCQDTEMPPSDPLFSHNNVEIFSPPYLFDSNGNPAVRPAIIQSPARIAYGQPFDLTVGNMPSNRLEQVVLVRLPSVTHGFNQDQRRVPLDFAANGEHGLNVTAPAAGTVCPPGPYMLFVINDTGVPSLAKMVSVGVSALSKDRESFPASSIKPDGLKGQVGIFTSPGASWQVTDVPAWVTITSPMSGTGSGVVNYSVQPNTGIAVRNATMTIAGQLYKIYQAPEFSDVFPEHGFHDLIGKLYARGITTGCSGPDPVTGLRRFCLGNTVTRRQMAVFIISALGVTPPTNQPNPFSDVVTGSSGYDFIVELYNRGISSGCGAVNPATGLRPFCPEGVVAREHMAIFLEIALGVNRPPKNTPQLFSDVPTGYWAYDFINDFGRRGISSGCGPVTLPSGLRPFCPLNPVNRGEMAVFLVQAFGL